MKPKRINADKPHLWNADIAASVDQFNRWFMRFAPKAFRSTRKTTAGHVKAALLATHDLRRIDGATLKNNPSVLSTLRMCTAPPLAVDRLIGLARVSKNLVGRMEDGKLPAKMNAGDLKTELTKLCRIISRLLDRDIFPWLDTAKEPVEQQRERASTIIADRLTNSLADPEIRNAQERRQLNAIAKFLKAKGYAEQPHSSSKPLTDMQPGTYCFRLNLVMTKGQKVKVPVDVAIQPKRPTLDRLPLLIEAKSAGDFTNTNKRRKEEAKKMRQLKSAYGVHIRYILFLGGYFDGGYLGYAVIDGFDWVWEHRIDDLVKLGL
ncbi:MAG: Type-2 restriction enzyme SalI [Nitrospira sp.]|nr:MAG: Type-2 restriction enzyme SalI [Nitrospira sp.]